MSGANTKKKLMKLRLDLDCKIHRELLESDVCSDDEDESYFDSHIHVDELETKGKQNHDPLRGVIYQNDASEKVRPVKLDCIENLYHEMRSSQTTNDKHQTADCELLAYNMASDGEYIGRCLIVNLDEEQRPGSSCDVDNLKNLFNDLGFNVHVPEVNQKNNIRKKQVEELDKYLADMDEGIDALSKVKGNKSKEYDATDHRKENLLRKEIDKLKDKLAEDHLSLTEKEKVEGDLVNREKELKVTAKDTGFHSLEKYSEDVNARIRNLTEIQHSFGARNMLGSLDEIITQSKDYGPEYYDEMKMFVLVLMGHGRDDYIEGATTGRIKLSDIYNRLAPDAFPAMSGKPKLIILQTCSGQETDWTVDNDAPLKTESHKNAFGSRPENPTTNLDTLAVVEASVQTETQWRRKSVQSDDLCIWLPCFPSHKAHREPHGSWFIRALIDVLHKHAHHMHLEQLFQRIQEKVRAYSIKRDCEKPDKKTGAQIPVSICSFTKGRRVYLFPGIKKVVDEKSPTTGNASFKTEVGAKRDLSATDDKTSESAEKTLKTDSSAPSTAENAQKTDGKTTEKGEKTADPDATTPDSDEKTPETENKTSFTMRETSETTPLREDGTTAEMDEKSAEAETTTSEPDETPSRKDEKTVQTDEQDPELDEKTPDADETENENQTHESLAGMDESSDEEQEPPAPQLVTFRPKL